jgi:hypothetical protein
MIAGIELRSWMCAALALAAGAALAPRPASAQDVGKAPDQGPHVVVRAYYLFDSFSHHESAFGVDTTSTVSYSGKPGGGVDAEYLFTPWLGIDVAASQTHIEADQVTRTPVGPAFETKDRIQVRPFMLGIYGHFYRVEHADVYLGPIVGLVQMSGGGRPDETNFGFGAALGIDLPLGSTGLAISGVGRGLASRFRDQLHNSSHFRDNFLFGGGLSYRW